jgi:N-acetylglucosaminyldiphosphoundecaprenol N-acetyl-beta-D-mannosaminyltransferase
MPERNQGTKATHPRGKILGVHVSAIQMADAMAAFTEWIGARSPHYVCVTPAHSIMECYNHPELRAIYNQSGLTTPDGMSVVWLLRWAGFKNVGRVYGPDLLVEACRVSGEKGWSHYFLGGAAGVPEKMIERLNKKFCPLRVAGIDSPPFKALSGDDEEVMCQKIQAAAPDILWVGLGSPRQERWMYQHYRELGVPVVVGVGAAFDFLSGNKPQAPRWMQRSGLEWLFRLACEPRRLWRRYIQYPKFILLVLLEKLGLLRINE